MATQLGFFLHSPTAKLGSLHALTADTTKGIALQRFVGPVNSGHARASVAVRAASGNTIRAAKKGSPPIMPAVLTPSGPVDLATLMFRNRIIFVGSPVNSEVCARFGVRVIWLE